MPRRADIKTGYSCNSNCVFCVIGDQLFTGDRPTTEVLEELAASRATCDDVVFTGAEVTLRPDFLQLVAAARRLGYRKIQVQTNGRRFAYPAFCEAAVRAGMNEYAPSIHGHTARLHDALTRAPGSFDQVVQSIRNLRALGPRIVSNTVATRRNMRSLVDLARLLVALGVDQYQIAFPHPTGHAATYFGGVVPRMTELAPHLRAALQVGIDAGVSCMAEAVPYCHMRGYERRVAELYIPPTEIVYEDFVVPDYERERIDSGKTRFPQCAPCRFEPICEGPWREYPAHVGSEEFQPVPGPRVIDGRLLLDDRFARLGEPAPSWRAAGVRGDGRVGELALDGFDAKWVAIAFYPQDGSPACTAQACSLQSGLAALAQAGVALVGVSPDPPARHQDFARAHGLGYPLVSDVDGAIAGAYGASSRSTYLLDHARRIAHVIVAPDVSRHAAEVLDAVRRLEAPARPLGGAERARELVVIRRLGRGGRAGGRRGN